MSIDEELRSVARGGLDAERSNAIGQKLLQEYSPVFVFHKQESYFPISIPEFVASGELRNVHGKAVDPEEWDGDKWINLRVIPSKDATHGNVKDAPVYGVVTRRKLYYLLQYYVFYGMNGKYPCLCCCCCNIDQHYGDLEYINIKIGRSNGKILSVYFSQGKGGMKVDWADIDRLDGTNHPIIYVAKYNHSMYPTPGKWYRTCGLKNDFTEQRQPGVNVWDPQVLPIDETTWWNQFVGDYGKVPSPFHSTSWRGGDETSTSFFRRFFCC